MARPAISVVVCTRNRSELLSECLDRLLDQDWPSDDYEIVVVDDGSTDATAAVVAAKRDRQAVRLVYAPRPHGGVNAARNTGVAEASGAVLFFVDDDELVRREQLSLLAARLRAHPDADAVGGPVRDFGGSPPRLCGECSWDSGVGWEATRQTAARLLGGNMAIRQECFEKVGLFDESLSGAGDEVEWFERDRDQLHLVYDPTLWLWHRRDSFSVSELVLRAYRQGRALPLFEARLGRRYRPRVGRLLRSLAHAARRRCTRGLLLAARETGAIAAWLPDALGRRTSAEAR